MINVDPLYLLLLIELLFILGGAAVYFFLRQKKYGALYQNSVKNLEAAANTTRELELRLSQIQDAGTSQKQGTGLPETAPLATAQDHENRKIELSICEDKLKEKTRLLVELQSKFDDLEKEYLILYRQQQAQDQNKQ